MQTVLTLGPESFAADIVARFLKTAFAFRINVAHLSLPDLASSLESIEKIFKAKNTSIPVILDLQGAKMRIGEYPGAKTIPEKVVLTHKACSKLPNEIAVPHAELFSQVGEGEVLLLNDAKIAIKVVKKMPNSLECMTLKSAPLSSFKGINREKHPLTYKSLTARDADILKICNRFSFVHYAFSFVFDGREAALLRPHIGNKKLIAKIELAEAMQNLEAIDRCFDAHWFCRGDLGAQVGYRNLGVLQRDFVNAFPRLTKPKFLAGQVLEHMTNASEPTRSEVVHLFDAESVGFDGIVLSDETAIGKNVLAVVDFLDEFYRGNKAPDKISI